MPIRPSLVLVAALALLGAGCGDDEGSGTTAPETTIGPPATTAEGGGGPDDRSDDGDRRPRPVSDPVAIIDTIEDVLISRRAERVCDQAITEAFLARAYGDRMGCINARAPATLARAVSVRTAEIRDGRATAEATPRGGIYDGEKLDVVLVRDGDRWRVDDLVADIPVGP